MGELRLQPVPFKTLPAPIIRLLPTIFTYVRLTAADNAEVGPDVHQRYVAHLRALKAILAAVAQAAGLAPETVEPLVFRCDSMVKLRGAELAETLANLNEGLQAFYKANRKQLRDAITDAPDLYRELYRAEVEPKRILAVYAEETWAESEKMGTKLTDRCWYDHRRHCESEGMVWLDGIDVVLFAPGTRRISMNIEAAVTSAEIPLVVLAGWSKKDDPQNMAELRTEFWYRRSGHRVLHSPFAPVRLYQAIDTLHLRHLAWLHANRRVMAAAAY